MKILILGANGMIGHRVLLEARLQFGKDVYGLMRRSKSDFGDYTFLQNNIFDKIDVNDWSKLESVLNDLRPDVVINAIGMTIRRLEISDLNKAMEINSFLPQKLSKWAQANSSKLIHFSTDCVFGGESGSYTEVSLPSAKDNYGKTKFLGEVLGDNSLTLRFSCIGQELDMRSELLEWFLSQKGKTLKGYTKALYSGVTSLVVAKETCRMIKDFKNLTGLFQISSQPISKYDLLVLANEYFENKSEIVGFDDFISDKTLISEKFSKTTGFQAPEWKKMMHDLAEDKVVIYKR
jgi:dTDP-4-dehydrorhamnose reductase